MILPVFTVLLSCTTISRIPVVGPVIGPIIGSGNSAHSRDSEYTVRKESNKITTRTKSSGHHQQNQKRDYFRIPGLFTISTTFDGRGLFLFKRITVKSTNVTINTWDDGTEDGDIISLYVNDSPAFSQFPLKNSKSSVNVSLNKNNRVYLYAHDMGKYPPCTAAFEIVDGNNNQRFELSADLQNSQGIEVVVE